jgi:hypothetical protein
MRAIPFDEVEPSLWNEICDSSDEAWLFHRHEWIRLEAKRLGAVNLSFAISRNDELVGLVPLLNSALPLGPFNENLYHMGLHRHSGVAISGSSSMLQRAEAERFALTTTISLANNGSADRLQLSVQNAAPRWRPGRPDAIPFWSTSGMVNFGIYSGPNGIMPFPFASTLALDQFYNLSVDPDTPGLGIASSARTAARKALNQGLEVCVEQGHLALAYVLDLAVKSSTRTGETVHEPTYFHDLLEGSCSEGVTTLLARDKTSKVVGALLIATYKNIAHFLHGYSDPEMLQYRVNDLLHYKAIHWARAAGMEFYRLGPFFPEVPSDWPISRVSRFKLKFANISVPIRQGSVFLQRQKYSDLGKLILAQH